MCIDIRCALDIKVRIYVRFRLLKQSKLAKEWCFRAVGVWAKHTVTCLCFTDTFWRFLQAHQSFSLCCSRGCRLTGQQLPSHWLHHPCQPPGLPGHLCCSAPHCHQPPETEGLHQQEPAKPGESPLEKNSCAERTCSPSFTFSLLEIGDKPHNFLPTHYFSEIGAE